MALGLSIAVNGSFAQDKYPTKPVRIIIGAPPGGVIDNSVRILTNVMQPSFGQPLIIDNKPGSVFAVAMSTLALAPTDGHTLLYVTSNMLSGQAVQKKYDMFKSLVPVAMIGATDITLAVGGKSQHKTVKELIAWSKSNPGKMTYASPGIGSLDHLALSNFCKKFGLDAVHVPYKGSTEVAQALMTGQADLGILPVPFIVQFGSKGMLRALLLLNGKRNPVIPEVPSIKDEQLDIPRLSVWGGMAAPAGTPKGVIEHLEKQLLAAMQNAELQKQFAGMGLAIDAHGAAEFGNDWKSDWSWISKAASEAKLDTN
jgi:tripartite-type tricarboxylate transporter receptor subunit TctC